MTIRPALRPGAVLLRRDAHHLQIGTSPGYVFRDQPGLFSVIHLLDGIRELGRIVQVAAANIPEFTGDVAQVVQELVSAGLVFDARSWDFPADPLLAGETRFASLSGSPPQRITQRSRFRVTLRTDEACIELTAVASAILIRSGFAAPADERADLMVIVNHGEPGRRQFEAAMDAGQDHLRVVVEEDRIRIGPLVRPGRTPCINCHDLHRSDWDSAWPALMTQFGRQSRLTSAPAICATTLHAAATVIAAEVIAHCDETLAETAGHCLVLGPHYRERRIWPVSFHPSCSCTLLVAA
ncbi:MAG: hypothetical protein ABIR57_09975 [Aeromicrobium sp.]